MGASLKHSPSSTLPLLMKICIFSSIVCFLAYFRTDFTSNFHVQRLAQLPPRTQRHHHQNPFLDPQQETHPQNNNNNTINNNGNASHHLYTIDTTSPSTVQGFIHKHGILNYKAWHLNYTLYRQTHYNNWISDRDTTTTLRQQMNTMETTTTTTTTATATSSSSSPSSSPSPSLPLPTPPLAVLPHGEPDSHHGCTVYYNEKYKFIYIRTPKVGGTTIMEYFPDCDYLTEQQQQQQLPSQSQEGMYNNNNTTSPPSPPPSPPPPLHCVTKLAKRTDLTKEELEHMWKTYFVFGFSRNVWRRAVSQYQYLVHFLLLQQEQQQESIPATLKCPEIKWMDFCMDPPSVADVCRKHPQCCPVRRNGDESLFYYFHLNDQTSCLLTEGGEWAVDFLGRVENEDEDLATVLKHINSRLLLLLEEDNNNTNSSSGDVPIPMLKVDPPRQINRAIIRCKDDDENNDNDDDDDEEEDTKQGLVYNLKLKMMRRRLQYKKQDGKQFTDVAYCTKDLFFQGKYSQCFDSITHYFAKDAELLHQNLTLHYNK